MIKSRATRREGHVARIEGEFMQGFDRKFRRKETARNSWAQNSDDIKKALKDTGCEGVG
jgi:hypothetical protein